jgi:N-acetylglutamate synthase-like GNAT family acetyltransferase
MSFTLRPTTLDDLDAVGAVLGAAYANLLAPDYPQETLAVIVPLISRAKPELVTSGTYFAAVDQGDIIAVGGWTRTRPGTNDIVTGLGHIRHVATNPMHLRRGAARAIMARCLDEARSAGLMAMECLSTRTAVPFYTSCGFNPVAERDVSIAGFAFPSVEMRLQLQPGRANA